MNSLRPSAQLTTLLTAVFVFASTHLASWIVLGNAAMMNYRPFVEAQVEMDYIGDRLSSYFKENGEYPASLKELVNSDHAEFLEDSDSLLDPWGNPYFYRKSNGGFELMSLGRDGEIGGRGLDADIYMGPGTRSDLDLPFSQFAFQTAGSGVVWLVAFAASVCAAVASYMSTNRSSSQRHSLRQLVQTVLVQGISAVIVGALLTAFYVMASQSGH